MRTFIFFNSKPIDSWTRNGYNAVNLCDGLMNIRDTWDAKIARHIGIVGKKSIVGVRFQNFVLVDLGSSEG